jgi:formylglycine-generating enzyme required for sulfatase activity
MPVDSFDANPFGLYQVHGNVWEWVEDCYHDSYWEAPADGSAWTTGNCKYRVLRGGSWTGYAKVLRAAFRGTSTSDVRDNNSSFGWPERLPGSEGQGLQCF